ARPGASPSGSTRTGPRCRSRWCRAASPSTRTCSASNSERLRQRADAEGAAARGRRLLDASTGRGRPQNSDEADVLGFVALASGSDVGLDSLTLVEGLVPVALDVGVVDEDVVAILPRDEAEALFRV